MLSENEYFFHFHSKNEQLEQESKWESLPRALTVQANLSDITVDAGNHQLLVCWPSLQHMCMLLAGWEVQKSL